MINKLKEDIDREIRLFQADVKKDLKLHTISPLLFEGIKDFVERPGKRIRPVLFILAYLGYTKKRRISRQKLLRASLSLELLHDFLLIHDDVIDKSCMRRGKLSLHRLFNSKLKISSDDETGSDLSIVAGDVIFALAVGSFLSFDGNSERKEKALVEFIKTAALTGAGEFIDITSGMKGIDKISRKEIFDICTFKTAEYTFCGPMKIGASLAGAANAELKKLSGLGIALGRAFQILDDLLDVFSTTIRTGKPVLSDLAESKKTLLVWETFRRLGTKDKKIFKVLFGKKSKTKEDLQKIEQLIIKSGARLYCVSKIHALIKEARSLSAGVKMKKRYKQELSRIIDDIALKTDALS
ncbi:MAG: polyprenyl synthetase family protein [Candidatus Omnitrophica bacterium]|nr:polyprenyl synthetase family protein [Candidatus Omnitrophota bacterium]MBU1783848.1 polyprenyl synthetase family protein [Candidatus Omnitrophota bacterium]MBU1851324.1 polyprenyl synthetase family protein [Candidatus Omnitrophota bacterium]